MLLKAPKHTGEYQGAVKHYFMLLVMDVREWWPAMTQTAENLRSPAVLKGGTESCNAGICMNLDNVVNHIIFSDAEHPGKLES